MKKNVFFFVGNHRKNSNSINYAKKLIFEIKNNHKDINVDFFSSVNNNIKTCLGCGLCFSTHKCKLDDFDDMKIIKEKMIKADLIILISPIYIGNVTSNMKVFFDRLSSWAHLMFLSSKPSIAVTISSGNAVHICHQFMYFSMSFLGLNVVDKYNILSFSDNIFGNEDFIFKKVKSFSKNIYNILDEKKINTNDFLEKIFKNQKLFLSFFTPIEQKYWKNKNILNFNTYKDFLKAQRKKSLNSIS